jgi:nitrous oxide reductase accessory protein NosL
MNKILIAVIAATFMVAGCKNEPNDKPEVTQVPPAPVNNVLDHIIAGAGGPNHEFLTYDSTVSFTSYGAVKFAEVTTGKPVYIGGSYVIIQQ